MVSSLRAYFRRTVGLTSYVGCEPKRIIEWEMRMFNNLAPIALFAFRRPLHLRRTTEALASNDLALQSKLYVFCDAAKDEIDRDAVDEVRRHVEALKGFACVEIIHHEQNLGLARSIITGVTAVLAKHKSIIVIEDDLVTSRHFLQYMNNSLLMYQDEKRVASIHGYVYPVERKLPETFFLRGADCWGWATWSRAWANFNPNAEDLLARLVSHSLTERFDLDGSYSYTQMLRDYAAGKNDSWAIRWHASAYLENMLSLYPTNSLVQNIGMDGSGTHCDQSDSFGGTVANNNVNLVKIPVEEHAAGREAFVEYFRRLRQVPEVTTLVPTSRSLMSFRKFKGWVKRRLIRLGLTE